MQTTPKILRPAQKEVYRTAHDQDLVEVPKRAVLDRVAEGKSSALPDVVPTQQDKWGWEGVASCELFGFNSQSLKKCTDKSNRRSCDSLRCTADAQDDSARVRFVYFLHSRASQLST